MTDPNVDTRKTEFTLSEVDQAKFEAWAAGLPEVHKLMFGGRFQVRFIRQGYGTDVSIWDMATGEVLDLTADVEW